MTTMKWDGDENSFWDAVAVANGEIESEESEAIQAAFILQEVLHLAQDALTRPEGTGVSPTAATVAAPKLRPQPGDIVSIERAAELFADRWILQPVDPDRVSPISAHRDYRWRDGQLEFNSSYPPKWQKSGGEISDVPQWRVMCQEADEVIVPAMPGVPHSNGVSATAPRASRTTIRTGT